MTITRIITYEHDNPETLKRQLELSLKDGVHDLMTKVTIQTVQSCIPTHDVQSRPDGWWATKEAKE